MVSMYQMRHQRGLEGHDKQTSNWRRDRADVYDPSDTVVFIFDFRVVSVKMSTVRPIVFN